jgi:hypothetical protein
MNNVKAVTDFLQRPQAEKPTKAHNPKTIVLGHVLFWLTGILAVWSIISIVLFIFVGPLMLVISILLGLVVSVVNLILWERFAFSRKRIPVENARLRSVPSGLLFGWFFLLFIFVPSGLNFRPKAFKACLVNAEKNYYIDFGTYTTFDDPLMRNDLLQKPNPTITFEFLHADSTGYNVRYRTSDSPRWWEISHTRDK